jgi:hypothetical protein
LQHRQGTWPGYRVRRPGRRPCYLSGWAPVPSACNRIAEQTSLHGAASSIAAQAAFTCASSWGYAPVDRSSTRSMVMLPS